MQEDLQATQEALVLVGHWIKPRRFLVHRLLQESKERKGGERVRSMGVPRKQKGYRG